MAAKAVQISLDVELLQEVDSDPETRQRGRSAFVRSAIELYLRAKRRKEIDRQIDKALAGQADEMQAEVEELMGAQAWPDD
ncbi:MAG TPA: ribbon-helix-helix protein, CopG family [Acidobacteriota bacterium]|nr:ribbon-helix-helix protein, CopG family [Acidobacteriota bacterium]